MRPLILLILFFACVQPDKAIFSPDVKPDTQTIALKYNDPVFFMGTGTSFPVYWQVLYRQGKFEEMVAWTSVQSIKRFSRNRILKYYQEELAFGYSFGKLTSQNLSDGMTVLNFANSVVLGTKRVTRFQVVIENDSCKILITHLKPNPF